MKNSLKPSGNYMCHLF